MYSVCILFAVQMHDEECVVCMQEYIGDNKYCKIIKKKRICE